MGNRDRDCRTGCVGVPDDEVRDLNKKRDERTQHCGLRCTTEQEGWREMEKDRKRDSAAGCTAALNFLTPR